MSHNVLIVDDSAITRAMIKRIVKLCDPPPDNIYEASDGCQALGLLELHAVDLVLADLHMPVMDGEEMARLMHCDSAMKEIPIVVISADPNATRMRELKKLGVRGHLAKPFTPEELRDLLDQLFGATSHA
jgi:two-component system chemotaxis response regulator CheY